MTNSAIIVFIFHQMPDMSLLQRGKGVSVLKYLFLLIAP